MALVRKAYTLDFDFVYPLLEDFHAEGMTKERWKLLFQKYWNTEEEHIGYLLEDNNQTVGFIGCVFSNRLINNNLEKFCGLSSWIVKNEYRAESIMLFSEILKLKNHTITSYSSIPSAINILTKLSFKILDSNYYYFPKKLNINIANKLKLIKEISEIKKELNDVNLKILEDHLQFKAEHILFKHKNDICYIIARKKTFYRKKLINVRVLYYLNRIYNFLNTQISVSRIHYISNLDFYNKYINEINKIISVQNETAGVLLESRFYKSKSINIKFKSLKQVFLFKSKNLKPVQIDSIYTELFILDY